MLLISDFRTYIEDIKNEIAIIERNEVAIDDSQITTFLGDCPDDDKYIVMGIIPKHKPVGNTDTIQSVDTASILILKKVTRSDHDHNTFLNTLAEAQQVTRDVILKMRADKINDKDSCSIMKFLTIESIDMNPIWGLAGCDGYEIDFSLQTNF